MDIFIEEMVLKKKTAGGHIASLALMFAGLLVVMALLFFLPLLPQLAPFILLLVAGGVLFIRFVMTSSHIEYEYALVNDELDVDKILGRKRRKNVVNVSVKDPEAFGKAIGAEFLRYANNPSIKKIYACREKNSEDNFFIVCNKSAEKTMLIITPSEKITSAIQKMNPKKVML